MELFEPQNFFQMADLIAGLLTGIIAIAGLLIALLTYKVAVKALHVWKYEKQFDIEVELKSKMGEALTILNKLNKTGYIESDLDEGQIWILNDLKKRFNDEKLIYIQKLESGFHNHYFRNIEYDLVKLRQISMKAMTYSSDEDIKTFYQIWSLYEGEIYNVIYNYCFINMNFYSEKYNFPQIKHNGATLPLPRLNYLLEQGFTIDQGIKILFDNLNIINKEDDYLKMLQIYRNTYFPIAKQL
ncbi:hypothetical protein [Sphingobacterium hotanense]|uniref:Phage abortive infection protein n=1 Tax=Sphingobacterium hotanense TaxID=649196 RepID=A0ABT7NQ51_9SPHI|nr:hypothetical protein [Sphingobacterium hotanense]MDM1049357.1 hypothetical protein [Sphingobacterium hotanense]